MCTRIRSVLALAAALLVSLSLCGTADAGQLHLQVCGAWSRDAGPFQPSASLGLSWQADCRVNGVGLFVTAQLNGKHVPFNASAGWQATAPAGITINHIYTINDDSSDIGDGQGWWGEFYWTGGRSSPLTDNFTRYGCCQASFSSQHVGWFFACNQKNGCSNYAAIAVGQLVLTASETRAPTIIAAANTLWYQSGWVRGLWPISFAASDPSGVCSTGALFGGQALAGPGGTKNQDTFHQCPDQWWSASVDTATAKASSGLGTGSVPLTLVASNAAGVSTGLGVSKTVYVDNQPPVVALSGPSDAPSSAGTQYVSAVGSAGPSGVSGIGCSVDGAPAQWYPSASAQVPVAGIGVHHVACVSANNALDPSGARATSAAASWTLNIREPTVSGIGFSELVDAMRCRRVRTRVRVAGHWVTVVRHHRRVRVRLPARRKVVSVVRCHPRIARRRITVWTTRKVNGKTVRVRRHKTIRVVLRPHVVTRSTRRVGHGRRTTVNGWLGLPNGVALGGQLIHVLAAADNGFGRFRQVATAVTAANGSWRATLPVGPSRLVEARYDGGASFEPSTSSQVRTLVPASVQLVAVHPRHVAWGGTVRITGQLRGGYLPAGGALVRLRIGFGRAYTTYGVAEHVKGRGRFTTRYTFGVGEPSVTRSYWFQIASLPMGDYPYLPSASRRLTVRVGGR